MQDLDPIRDIAGRREFLRRVADAGLARDEDHAHWRQTRNLPGVVHGAARKIHGRKIRRARCGANRGLDPAIGEGGLNVIDLGAYGRRAFFTVDVGEPLLGPLAHVLDLCGIEIAELVWKLHPDE